MSLKLMLMLYQYGGRGLFRFCLFFVIAFYFIFSPLARRASGDFLRRVYETTNGALVLKKRPTFRDSIRHFLSFGDSILDKLAAWMGKISYKDLNITNSHLMTDLQKSKRGAVIISAHIGNIEVCRAISEVEGKYPLVILMYTRHAAQFNKLILELNPDSEISVVQVEDVTPDVAIRLQQVIDAGGFLVVLGDRTPASQNGQTKEIPFLGEPAAFSKGPLVLAGLFDCPVLLMFCVKEAGRYRLIFEAFADTLKSNRKEREVVIERALTLYVERLTYYAVRYPYQWYNFYNYWASSAKPGEAIIASRRK